MPRTHFEAHFSQGWRRSTRFANERRRHPLKAPCLHLSQKGTSIVKKQKERALSLPGKLPAPYKSRDFALRFGSGSPLPLINAWYDGYLWTLPVFVRVRRQKYWPMTSSDRLSDTRLAWRPTAAIWLRVLCMSCSSSLKFLPHRARSCRRANYPV